MEEGDLRAVAECLGWAFEDEFANGAVSGAEEVDAEIAQAVHDGVGVEVAAGESAGEQP